MFQKLVRICLIGFVIFLFFTLVLGMFLVPRIKINNNVTPLTESNIQLDDLYVYLDTDITEKEAKSLYTTISNMNGVELVEFSSKEEQLEDVTNSFGIDGDPIQENFSGEKNPLNDVFIVTVNYKKEEILKQEIEELNNVESVE